MIDPEVSSKLFFELNVIVEALHDSKISKRREGREKLDFVLNSLEYLECLDHETAKLHPTDAIGIVTWPGVLGLFLEHASYEAQRAFSRQKNPETAVSKLLRHLIDVAAGSRRRSSGRGGLLQRRVQRLFQHIADTFVATGLSSESQYEKDYLLIFRNLLEENDYCLSLKPALWHHLFCIHLEWLQNLDWFNERRDQGLAIMETLSIMLEKYSGDISFDVTNDIIIWILNMGKLISEMEVGSQRISTCILRIAVHLLFKCGKDIASSCRDINESLHKIAFSGLRGRDSILKSLSALYYRQMLTLGGVSWYQLNQLYHWANEQSRKPQWKAASHLPPSSPLNESQFESLSLIAVIITYYTGILKLEVFDDDKNEGNDCQMQDIDDANNRPAKRIRVDSMSTMEDLGKRASNDPAAAAPIACLILLQYENIFPVHYHKIWSKSAMMVLSKTIEQAAMSENLKVGTLLWLLRFILSLAHTVPLDSIGNRCCEKDTWVRIWNELVRYLNQEEIDVFEKDTALWILSYISGRRLITTPATSHMLWNVPLLEFKASSGSIAFIEALLNASIESVAHIGSWEPRIFQWMESNHESLSSCTHISKAIEAYLHLSNSEREDKVLTDIPCLPSFSRAARSFSTGRESIEWIWWIERSFYELKLRDLIRGTNLMRAKVQIVSNESAEAKHRNQLEAGSTSHPPVGIQMHQLAADTLEKLIDKSLQVERKNKTKEIQQEQTDIVQRQKMGEQWKTNEKSYLLGLLNVCAAAIHVIARVCLSEITVKSGSVPVCWKKGGSLSAMIHKALERIGTRFIDVLTSQEGLSLEEAEAWQLLLSAIKLHRKANLPSEYAESLKHFFRPIECFFSFDASTVARKSVSANHAALTQYSVKADAMHMTAAFDDDLDMEPNTNASGSSKRMQNSLASSEVILSSSSLAEEYRYRCCIVLCQLSALIPITSFLSVKRLIENREGLLLSTSHLCILNKGLTTAAATAITDRCFEGPEFAKYSLNQLNDIISLGKNSIGITGRMNNVLNSMRELISSLHSNHGLASAEECIAQAEEMFFRCLDICNKYYSESSFDLRIAVGQTAVELILCSLKCSREVDGERINFIVQWVKSLLMDSNYSARMAGIHLSQIIFTVMNDSKRIFSFFRSSLPISSPLNEILEGDQCSQDSIEGQCLSPEYVETAIFLLGETIIQHGSLEINCILDLIVEAVHQTNKMEIIKLTFDWVSISLGYSDRYDFALFYRPQLIFCWFNNYGLSLDQLISVQGIIASSYDASLSSKTGITKFLSEIAQFIVSALVFKQDESEMVRLAEKVQYSSVSHLIKEHVDSILSLIIPAQFSSSDAIQQKANEAAVRPFVRDIISTARSGLSDSVESTMIVSRMLEAAQSSKDSEESVDPVLPYFRPEVVLEGLTCFLSEASSRVPSPTGMTSLLNEDRIHFILLNIQKKIESTKNPRHTLAALGSFQTLLLLLEKHIARPIIFRYATSNVLRLMKTPSLRSVCCAFLSTIIKNTVNAAVSTEGFTLEIIGLMLPAITSTLAETIQQNLKDGLEVQNIMNLLNYIVLDTPKPIQRFMAYVQPLPMMVGLQEAASKITKERKSMTLLQHIEAFAEKAESMSDAERRNALQVLDHLLDNGQEIEEEIQEQSARRIFSTSAWRLAFLSSKLQDNSLAQFAGKCLAINGPLEPRSVAFDAPSEVQPDFVSESKHKMSPDNHSMWLTVIKLLTSYVTDDDTPVVEDARRALRFLLRTQEAKATLRDSTIDQMTREMLKAFEDSLDVIQNPLTATNAVEDPEIWKFTDTTSYKDWVCKLAYVLCSRAVNPSIHACHYIVQHKQSLAELLIPFACEDLALYAGTIPRQSDSISASIAKMITDGMIPESTKRPEVMHLLLRCLNHLRGRYLDAMEGSKVFSCAKKWQKVYWFDIDYLILAGKAVECRAYFSALIYIEEWCQQENNGILDLSVAIKDQNHLVRRLLLEIYSHINEPDGLYAVACSNDLLSQFRRSERERDWNQMLVTCDLAFHLSRHRNYKKDLFSSGEISNTSSIPNAIHGISDFDAKAGIMRALACMGASGMLKRLDWSVDALEDDKQSHMKTNNGMKLFTNEQFLKESSRLGHWLPSLDEASADFADPSLSAALDALRGGSAERCSEAIRSGRNKLVAELTAAGLESSGDINPALIRLQMFQEISDTWELLWPNLPPLKALSTKFPSSNLNLERNYHSTREKLKNMDSADSRYIASLQEMNERWRRWELRLQDEGNYHLRSSLQNLRLDLLSILRVPSYQADALNEAAMAARKASYFGQATNYLYQIRSLPFLYAEIDFSREFREIFCPHAPWHVEEAKLLWARGQADTAISLLLSMLPEAKNKKSIENPVGKGYLEALAAKWMAETQRESSSSIIGRFKRATELLAQPASQLEEAFPRIACRVMYRLARYTDSLYRGIQDRKSSSDWLKFETVILDRTNQLVSMEKQLQSAKIVTDSQGQQRFSSSHYYFLAKQIKDHKATLSRDIKERDETLARERELLHQALKSYGSCLNLANDYDLQCMFRVIDLWLKLGQDGKVVDIVREIIKLTPSYKFLDLIYQIASRLSASSNGPLVASGFQATLQEMLIRIGSEHPYHSLLQIFALKNAQKGKDGKTDLNKTGYAYAADQERMKAAEQILFSIASKSSRLKHIIAEYESIIEDYISLAAVPVDKSKQSMPVPAKLHRRLRSLEYVPILTAAIPVDISLRYDEIPTVSSVEMMITFPGGINKPKKMIMIDSQGHVCTQLVKGGSDDLRQDAVMQQFFRILNKMLGTASPTSARDLKIRTYGAVPLSPASGLLEWVDNTQPLLSLIGHSRYRRKGDLAKVHDGYLKLAAAHEKCRKSNNGNLLPKMIRPVFDDICQHLLPVLHHYFLEKYRRPGEWFESRLRYTRSVAVSSMAGHIIGLGDRHPSNILVDGSTAEVVHIDLGIAFEQGHLLPTPEKVPFRLTRNIIDGMGVTGVEGVMRRCCEASLRVLRNAKDPLMTILEVFVHDPLYNWALTFKEMHRRQKQEDRYIQESEDVFYDDDDDISSTAGGTGERENDIVGNTDANRTLLRIRRKLEGIEYGDNAPRSVEGQVAFLMAEAMDPDNLCCMYHGWGAHL